MRLVHAHNQGAPLGLIKVHPSRRRFVAFSATVDEAVLWGWDFGCLERVARLGPRRERRAVRKFSVSGGVHQFRKDRFDRDVAFHPDGVYLATAGEGRPIEIHRLSDGELMRTIGNNLDRDRSVESQGHKAATREYPPEHQGFDRVAFADGGHFLVAGPTTCEGSHVFGFGQGASICCLWRGFAPFAWHAREKLIAFLCNDSGGATIRFARVQVPFALEENAAGACPPRVKVSDAGPESGWCVPTMVNVSGMVFSPAGDAFALSGEVPGSGRRVITVSVHDFPSWRTRFVRNIEFDDDLVAAHLPAPWPIATHPVAFDQRGRRLFIPEGIGLITVLDAVTGEELDYWDAHADQVTSIDVQQKTATLVSGDLGGEVKVWRL
jgi:hypothetical protein